MGSTVGRRSLALLCAAVVGVALGVVVAVQTAEPEKPAATDGCKSNPLELENSCLVNLPECDSSYLLIVGWGSTPQGLTSSIGDFGDQHVRYLDREKSCPTAYPSKSARYYAYLPPITSPMEACKRRMQSEQIDNFLTRLNDEVKDEVLCPCVLPLGALYELAPTDATKQNDETRLWLPEYQRMLEKADLLPAEVLAKPGFGNYFNKDFSEATRILQTSSGLNAPVPALVTPDTWSALRNKTCSRFKF